jgi:hypothetical protein
MNGESLTSARVGLFQFWTPIRRKLEELEKHKKRIFSNKVRPNFGISIQLFFLWINFYAQTPYRWVFSQIQRQQR